MGQAFLFVPLLAATWIVGLYFAMIASHYFLSVLESSAAGNDSIEMPVEPFVDWVGKVVYLGFFVVIWGVPSLTVMAATKGQDEFIRMVMIGLPFWLLFPIGILSPLALVSRWVPFYPGLVSRMMQKFSATVQMYLLTFPVAMLFFYCFGMLVKSETSYVMVFILSPLTALCFLVYARLVGRLGFVLSFTRGIETEKVKKPTKPKRPRPVVPEEAPVYVQPSEMKAIRNPFDDEEVTGYSVNFVGKVEEQKAPPPKIEEEESYIIEDGLEVEESPAPVRETGSKPPKNNPGSNAFDPPLEEEVQLYSKKKKLKEPKVPFGSDSILFLASPDMIRGLLKLGAGMMVLSLLIHFLGALRPV
jgi:hypothetical protein